MNGKIRSRGNRNSWMHIRRRRILVAQIILDMQRDGEVPINKEVVLERLEFFGYGTKMRSLERDIAVIFTSEISAVLPGRSYKLKPGTKYLKVIESEYNDDLYVTFSQGGIGRRTTPGKRAEGIQGIMDMLDLVQRKADDLSEVWSSDKTT